VGLTKTRTSNMTIQWLHGYVQLAMFGQATIIESNSRID